MFAAGARVRVQDYLQSLPDYFMIHLKRFRPEVTDYVKVLDSIRLETSTLLDLRRWCTDDTTGPNLNGVLGDVDPDISSEKSEESSWACSQCTLLNPVL